MHILTYRYNRTVFSRNEFKPFIKKWFVNPVFKGSEDRVSYPKILVENWSEVKHTIPLKLKPIKVESYDFVLEKNPNICIQNIKGFNVQVIIKERENGDNCISIALAAMRLESRELDMVFINDMIFSRENFEFKTGRFNKSKCLDLMMWQFHRDILEEIVNS